MDKKLEIFKSEKLWDKIGEVGKNQVVNKNLPSSILGLMQIQSISINFLKRHGCVREII